jgi:uncharacterized protein
VYGKLVTRYLAKTIAGDLDDQKMVFIGGPRQAGKTTLALSFLLAGRGGRKYARTPEAHPAYLNWDWPAARSRILRADLPVEFDTLVFDEVHKFRKWRNLLKGFYDTHHSSHRILVTGSARLDHYRKGGDSLLGRYHYFRLHPLSLPEARQALPTEKGLTERLLAFGGFPEPFFKASPVFHRRWLLERRRRVLNEDLRDLEQLREVTLLELMLELLPQRVGSPLSVQNLANDLESTHPTVKHWLEITDNLCLTFRIAPFGTPRVRAVKKEQKLYLWDWTEVEDEAARFENMMACHLLKYCHYREDVLGYPTELRYLRDIDGRELDFVVLAGRKPQFAVECKLGEVKRSKHLAYFAERAPIPQFYQVHLGKEEFGDETRGGRVIPFARFCDLAEMV